MRRRKKILGTSRFGQDCWCCDSHLYRFVPVPAGSSEMSAYAKRLARQLLLLRIAA